MSMDRNGSNAREQRLCTPRTKVAIVKQHLVEGVSISDLCDSHRIQSTQFYQWQKQLFERKTELSGPTPAERHFETLRANQSRNE